MVPVGGLVGRKHNATPCTIYGHRGVGVFYHFLMTLLVYPSHHHQLGGTSSPHFTNLIAQNLSKLLIIAQKLGLVHSRPIQNCSQRCPQIVSCGQILLTGGTTRTNEEHTHQNWYKLALLFRSYGKKNGIWG